MEEDRLMRKLGSAGYPRGPASRMCETLSSVFLTRIEGAADYHEVRRIVKEAQAEMKATIEDTDE